MAHFGLAYEPNVAAGHLNIIFTSLITTFDSPATHYGYYRNTHGYKFYKLYIVESCSRPVEKKLCNINYSNH